MVTTDVLKSVPLFSAMPNEQLAALAGCATLRRYPRSTLILRAGEETDGLEILINNAGVMGSHEGLEEIDLDRVRRTFEVNAIGPIRVTRAFVDLLMAGERPRRIVNMTSLMGSIDDNRSGDAYAYRMSKAALNMLTGRLAAELAGQGTIVVSMSPGWVATDMGGPSAPLEPPESVQGMLNVVNALTPAQSGTFLDHAGAVLPW